MKSLAILSTAALLAGCANTFTPQYDARFGQAVRNARLAQTLNPDAAQAAAPVGMDGAAANEAVVRYQDSFKAPPPVVNVINIGGAVGGRSGGQ